MKTIADPGGGYWDRSIKAQWSWQVKEYHKRGIPRRETTSPANTLDTAHPHAR